MSRPVWGAWIEILSELSHIDPANSRAPYGARGLKFLLSLNFGVTRHGSRPVWGAWIEIPFVIEILVLPDTVAPRMGRVD